MHGLTTACLPDPKPRPNLLLRLPPAVRRRVYCYLGLTPWYRDYPSLLDLGGRRPTLNRASPSCFHGLLLSCRAIYAETAALLYSTGRFVLYATGAYPASRGYPTTRRRLRPLHALTPTALLSLSNLKVVLNEAACHDHGILGCLGACCLAVRDNENLQGRSWCRDYHRGRHQLPLPGPAVQGDDDDTATARAMLGEWQSAAACLSRVAPGRLALSLVCDIDPGHPRALELAGSAVAPILLLPPSHLRECHIRLAKTAHGPLRQIAEEAASHARSIATPYTTPTKAGALVTLPPELRIRILEYTDLVTPTRQVTWSRQDRGYLVLTCAYGPHSTPDERHAAQFFRCFVRTNGCFCRRRHAASSPACRCWAPPAPLFLVCRALREDARLVFFSSNRFVVHDFKACPPWGLPRPDDWLDDPLAPCPYPHERFAACRFLREVVPARALAHLRFLELVFPPYHPSTWPETRDPVMQGWWATVDWLRGKVNPPGLTLRLVVANADIYSPESYRDPTTLREGDAVMKAYMDLLHPLIPLANDGLAAFYAHFADPWQWNDEWRNANYGDRRPLDRRERDIKEQAERYVMGPDGYARQYADERVEPNPGDWHKAYFVPERSPLRMHAA